MVGLLEVYFLLFSLEIPSPMLQDVIYIFQVTILSVKMLPAIVPYLIAEVVLMVPDIRSREMYMQMLLI